MGRMVVLCGVLAALAACGGAPRSDGGVAYTPARDVIPLNDTVSRNAARDSSWQQAVAQCAAKGRIAHYVGSQARLSANANEHLYMCY